MNKLKWLIFAIVVFTAAACEKGLIPVLITDIDSISLPQYTPPDMTDSRYSVYGTDATRVNADDMRIKYQYNSSDDVTHIILGGEIANGIPEGLLWNENSAGAFGVPAGSYEGRGDFRVGTLNTMTGGSEAIGSVYFDSEWVMGGFYTAVVLNGVIDDKAEDVTVTETNESLRLFSKQLYRDRIWLHQDIFSVVDGKMRKKKTYTTYNPNDFHKWPDPQDGTPDSSYNVNPGAKRGGYYILISSKAYPRTAFLEVEYADSSRKRIEIDYSGVGFKGVPLTGLALQNPSPAISYSGTYSLGTPTLSEAGYYQYSVAGLVDPAGSISNTSTPDNLVIPQPLYLIPLYITAYGSVSIDPKKTATNMISKVTIRRKDDEGGGILQDTNLVAAWEDKLQSINVYYKFAPADLQYTGIVIRADLREQPVNVGIDSGIRGIECIINFYIPPPP
jgi:hypothetical protein